MAATGISYSANPVAPVNATQAGSTNVQTGVTPTQVYSPEQTQDQLSQMYAQAFQQANPLSLMSTVYNPSSGTQLGANALGKMAPLQAGILSGAQLGAANLQASNANANANSLLSGQQLDASTGLDLAGLQSQQNQMNYGQNIQNAQYGQTLLGDVLGGSGGGGGFLGNLLGGII